MITYGTFMGEYKKKHILIILTWYTHRLLITGWHWSDVCAGCIRFQIVFDVASVLFSATIASAQTFAPYFGWIIGRTSVISSSSHTTTMAKFRIENTCFFFTFERVLFFWKLLILWLSREKHNLLGLSFARFSTENEEKRAVQWLKIALIAEHDKWN